MIYKFIEASNKFNISIYINPVVFYRLCLFFLNISASCLRAFVADTNSLSASLRNFILPSQYLLFGGMIKDNHITCHRASVY